MATKLQALGYFVFVRATGEVLAVGRDAVLIGPNDLFAMADGSDIPEALASKIAHRPEGFSSTRKTHLLDEAFPAACEEDLKTLKSGTRSELKALASRLLGVD